MLGEDVGIARKSDPALVANSSSRTVGTSERLLLPKLLDFDDDPFAPSHISATDTLPDDIAAKLARLAATGRQSSVDITTAHLTKHAVAEGTYKPHGHRGPPAPPGSPTKVGMVGSPLNAGRFTVMEGRSAAQQGIASEPQPQALPLPLQRQMTPVQGRGRAAETRGPIESWLTRPLDDDDLLIAPEEVMRCSSRAGRAFPMPIATSMRVQRAGQAGQGHADTQMHMLLPDLELSPGAMRPLFHRLA